MLPPAAWAVLVPAVLLAACAAPPSQPHEGHRVLLHGNGKLAIVEPDGSISLERPWGGIHDLHLSAEGHVFVQRGWGEVVELDLASGEVLWSYASGTSHGNAGVPVEVHAFQPLAQGRMMIAESGPARVLEVERDGSVISETPLTVDHPHPHMDTRLVRKIAADRYLVCHEGDGVVREIEQGSGRVVWEYDVPLFGREKRGGHGPDSFGDKVFGALRLENGNTLIATGNGHSVLEVTPAKEIVWRLSQDELDGIRLAWVTTLEVLPNGHYVIGNCHAGPGQPLLIEIEPKSKRVVWTLDRYEDFGNSVSNSLLLDVPGALR